MFLTMNTCQVRHRHTPGTSNRPPLILGASLHRSLASHCFPHRRIPGHAPVSPAPRPWGRGVVVRKAHFCFSTECQGEKEPLCPLLRHGVRHNDRGSADPRGKKTTQGGELGGGCSLHTRVLLADRERALRGRPGTHVQDLLPQPRRLHAADEAQQ